MPTIRSRPRTVADHAAGSSCPSECTQPRRLGGHRRESAARVGARRRGHRPLRLGCRLVVVARARPAGLQGIPYGPPRVVHRRGRNVSPRASQRSLGALPRRAASVPSTLGGVSRGRARGPGAKRAALRAWRPGACAHRRVLTALPQYSTPSSCHLLPSARVSTGSLVQPGSHRGFLTPPTPWTTAEKAVQTGEARLETGLRPPALPLLPPRIQP